MKLPLPIARMQQFAPLLLVLASAAVAVAAYLQALNYPFVSDDAAYVTENTKLAGLPLAELWRLFTEPYNDFEFLPLRDFSYWLDITLFGITPPALRLHNIFLYLLCLPLVYGATLGVWRYFRPADAASASWAAAAVTALFTVHPAHVEAVVWVTGRKDVLSGLFSMLALWLAVSAKREEGFSAPHAIAALVAFAAAMLSKASYVAVAPIIALLWLVFWRDTPAPKRRYSPLLWPFAILSLAVFLILIFTASSMVKAPVYFGIEAVTQSLAVLGRLTNLAITPGSRQFNYPVTEIPYFTGMVVLGIVALIAFAAGLVMSLRKRSLEGFTLVAFLLICIPYLQLIPFKTFALVQDRYVTLAVWPVILLAVALSWRLKPLPRTALLLVIALLWGFQTIERPRDWRNSGTLLDADLRAYPGYYIPVIYKIISVQLPHGLYREAREAANNITIPKFRDVTVKLVEAYHAVHVDALATGEPQKAMVLLWDVGLDLKQRPVQAKWNSSINILWEREIYLIAKEWWYLAEHFPDDVSVRYNAGLWHLNSDQYQNAVAYLREATESQRLPESMRGSAFRNLGLALISFGQVAEAEAPLRAALEQSPPDTRAYCLLSSVYKQTKRLEEAARAEAECRKQAPSKGMAP